MRLKLPLWTRTFDPWVWAAGALALIACLALIIWFVTEPGRVRQRLAASQAQAQATIAQGQAKAGSDAIGLQDAARTAAEQNEALHRENADAIRQAPGADQPLDPDLNRVARERLCQRPSYRGSSECLQYLDRAQPARAR